MMTSPSYRLPTMLSQDHFLYEYRSEPLLDLSHPTSSSVLTSNFIAALFSRGLL